MIANAGRRDDGLATAPVLVIALVLLVVALALAAGAQVAIAGARARSAADLASLAAAGQLAVPEVACRQAARFATANGALLTDCSVAGDSVAVRVVVAVAGPAPRLRLPRQVAAIARAGYPP